MSKHNELEDFVNGLVQPTKIAESDLDLMSVSELEALIGLDLTTDDEKVAYLDACVKEARGDDRYGSWLEQFEGSPLKAKALQLCEQELALEQQRLQRRIDRDAQMKEEETTWTQQDMLRLQKDMLMLELHKSKSGMGAGAGGADPTMQPQAAPAEPAAEEPTEEVAVVAPEEPAPAAPPKPKADKKPVNPAKEEGKTAGLLAAIEKRSNDVQTVGQVNNGDPNSPTWPRAALGVDSAGRRATAEEAAQQSSHGMPKTNPAQAIQAGRQFGAPVVANASVLDQLSRTSFDKLSVSKSWITRTIRRAKATKLRVQDSAKKHDAAWWDHRVKGTELTDSAKKRGLAADELVDKYKNMKGTFG